MARPRMYEKRTLITILLEPEILEELDEIARDQGVSRNALIRNIVMNSDKEVISKFTKEVVELRKAVLNLSKQNKELQERLLKLTDVGNFYMNIEPDEYCRRAYENLKDKIPENPNIDIWSRILMTEYEKELLKAGKYITNKKIEVAICKKLLLEEMKNE